MFRVMEKILLAVTAIIIISCSGSNQQGQETASPTESEPTDEPAATETVEVSPLAFSCSCEKENIKITLSNQPPYEVKLTIDGEENVEFVASRCEKEAINIDDGMSLFIERYQYYSGESHATFYVSFPRQLEPALDKAEITIVKNGVAYFEIKDCCVDRVFGDLPDLKCENLPTSYLSYEEYQGKAPPERQKLQWVGIDNYGDAIWYQFKNEKGHDIIFKDIDIAGFSLENNSYFEPDLENPSIYTQYKFKEGIKDQWYWIEKTSKEVEVAMADDATEVIDVIVKIYPAE